ncbi:uncharacterized protein TM35_000881020 [Trypanosoma theileri]|uniref:Uncharacterized protein n=1 Tax=Trypanosoma theileri TaxID=67003 RepID=A0A1X0NEK8_9TRYP|nr:uncharacterized protein TM35_000881020 [Trypanosoma theileri]ORC82523.1 hypothetical protein TM35_000881020 [Trypanosoma theileri]
MGRAFSSQWTRGTRQRITLLLLYSVLVFWQAVSALPFLRQLKLHTLKRLCGELPLSKTILNMPKWKQIGFIKRFSRLSTWRENERLWEIVSHSGSHVFR